MIPNNQPIEKQEQRADDLLSVHSIFGTIQGEGPFVGRPAVFVRLAGCNLQCPLCDTDYTLGRRLRSVAEILIAVQKEGHSLVVITGGEPFRQTLLPLILALLAVNLTVQIETNGTLFQVLPFDKITIICSPKTGRINAKLRPFIAAYKYVIHSDSVSAIDGLPIEALGHPNKGGVARPEPFKNDTISSRSTSIIYVQPVDDHREVGDISENPHLRACVTSCMKHGYTLGIQIHKLIKLP